MKLQNAAGTRGVGADSWINQLKETANALQFVENNGGARIEVMVVSSMMSEDRKWRPAARRAAKSFAWRRGGRGRRRSESSSRNTIDRTIDTAIRYPLWDEWLPVNRFSLRLCLSFFVFVSLFSGSSLPALKKKHILCRQTFEHVGDKHEQRCLPHTDRRRR